MDKSIKLVSQTPKKKLLAKIKESDYHFDKEEFRKFQVFFSDAFSNIDIDEARKQAWRKR